jgi:alcohol dehydrogenase
MLDCKSFLGLPTPMISGINFDLNSIFLFNTEVSMQDLLRSFQIKTRIAFGKGALSELAALSGLTGATKCLLVADPVLEKFGFIAKAREILNKAGIESASFTDVEPEPYLDGADSAAALGRKFEADLVIGIGGGSVLDTAKAAAALITNEGKAEDYIGLNKVDLPGLATIMVPTTSGTGSEVTFTAVFTNRETKAKGGINSPHLYPDIAILDSELTLPLPAQVTATTGMDALTHAIESVSSRSSTVFTEALALTAIRLIAENLRRAVSNGDDIEARSVMLYASCIAGLALADAGVGAAHALAYPLGGFYRIPHGLANAILIPYVMDFNAPSAESQYASVARAFGVKAPGMSQTEAALAAARAVRELCADIGIPKSLNQVGVPIGDMAKMVDSALKVTRPVENNPRVMGAAEAEMIYRAAFS